MEVTRDTGEGTTGGPVVGTGSFEYLEENLGGEHEQDENDTQDHFESLTRAVTGRVEGSEMRSIGVARYGI